MSIKLANTTIAVKRPPEPDPSVSVPEADPYDPASATPLTTVVVGVRALFASPSRRTDPPKGGKKVRTWRLLTDPCDLRDNDVVVDERTAEEFDVDWAYRRAEGKSIDHMAAEVYQVLGAGT